MTGRPWTAGSASSGYQGGRTRIPAPLLSSADRIQVTTFLRPDAGTSEGARGRQPLDLHVAMIPIWRPYEFTVRLSRWGGWRMYCLQWSR